MVKIKCPVCDGDGKVPSDFGGGCPNGAKKQCPACCGTGMQEVADNCWKPCRKTYPVYPWYPCSQPYTYPWTNVIWSGTSQPGSLTPSSTGTYTSINNGQASYTSCSL